MARNRWMLLIAGFALVAAACSSGSDDTTTTTAAPTTTTAAPTTTTAAFTTTTNPAPTGDAVRGGLLFDKWWKVAGLDEPAIDMPVWARQTTNTRTGADTWRCKECHGWDYQGADGAYGSGSHFTGFPGIIAGAAKAAGTLTAMITGQNDPDHDFSVLSSTDVDDLVAFIIGGLIDVSSFIDADKMIVGGDSAAGETLYTATCAACHGADGRTLNFGGDDDPEYVGTIAAGNPWEFVHKVRFGQPGTEMPSAITLGWSDADVANVAAYSQTLPTEPVTQAAGDAVRGGLLYDKWWTVAGLDAPTDDIALWARQTTNTRTGADTWRCKECHGWDYEGSAGAYGSGSHFTGFPGVLDAAARDAASLAAQIGGQTDPDHDFSMLSAADIEDLVAFITQAVIDVAHHIDADKAIIGGDTAAGETLYTQACAACHGADGKTLNFGDDADPEYVGTIAAGNPWEFVHKTRFGQPGTGMPSAITLGWGETELFNVAAYSQTLPTE